MSEEKKPNIIIKGIKKAGELLFVFVVAFLFSLWIGEKIDCDSTNRFIMQNLWDGGINCPVE
ncbi:MAG: hypothetical protein CMI54_04740 [Parcubacteria group bacterium]|nr:hypothetical protein [Parcubacteria group bacterium]|tara:strand:+ start:36711 stop:36896 length:186 start_codon:yes stop_codon:yes gene_type:complete